MASPNDIVIGLEADAVTKRRQAFKQLEELLQHDKRRGQAVVVSSQEWNKLLKACMHFEVKELDAAAKKHSTPSVQHAAFWRNLLRHTLGIVLPVTKTISTLLRHSIKICDDNGLDQKYRAEHRALLVDILENVRVIHCVTAEHLRPIYQYLNDSLVLDPESFLIASFLRLVVALSKALFVPQGRSLLEPLCTWLSTLIIASDDATLQTSAIITVITCYTIFIEYFSVNAAECIFAGAKFALGYAVKLLASSGIRDSNRDTVLKFLFHYLKLSTSAHYSLEHPISPVDPILTMGQLAALNVYFTDETFLKAMTQLIATAKTKDVTYTSSFSDHRIRLNIEVAVQVGWFYERSVGLQPVEEDGAGQRKRQRKAEFKFDEFLFRLLRSVSLKMKSPAIAGGRASHSLQLEIILVLLDRSMRTLPALLSDFAESSKLGDCLQLLRMHLQDAASVDDCHAVACIGYVITSFIDAMHQRDLLTETVRQSSEWNQLAKSLATLLTSNDKSHVYMASAIASANALLQRNLLSRVVSTEIYNAIASLAPLRNPRSLDNPCYFQALAVLIGSGKANALSHICSDVLATSQALPTEFAKYREEGGVARALLCVTIWMESTLASPSSCRAVSALVGVYAEAIRGLLEPSVHALAYHAHDGQFAAYTSQISADLTMDGTEVNLTFTSKWSRPNTASPAPRGPSAGIPEDDTSASLLAIVKTMTEKVELYGVEGIGAADYLTWQSVGVIFCRAQGLLMHLPHFDWAQFWATLELILDSVHAVFKRSPKALSTEFMTVLTDIIAEAARHETSWFHHRTVPHKLLALLTSIRDVAISSASDIDAGSDSQIPKGAGKVVEEDDFLETPAVRRECDNSLGIRAKFSSDVIEIISRAIYCYVAISRFSDNAITEVTELLRFTSVAGYKKVVKLLIPTEHFLDIADYLAKHFSHSGILTIAFSNQIDVELGAVGYCRLLKIACTMLSHSHHIDQELIESSILKLVFPDDDHFESFAAAYWAVPYMQAKCAELITPGASQLAKNSLGDALLEHWLHHEDFRVRLSASIKLPLLFQKFPNSHNAIYEDTLVKIGASLEASQDAYALATAAIAVGCMIAGAGDLPDDALCHVLELIQALTASSFQLLGDSGNDLMRQIVTHIAKSRGYMEYKHFLMDHINIILSRHLSKHPVKTLPFQMFGYSSIGDFVEDFTPFIMIHISVLERRRRFAMAQEILDILKFTSNTDGAVASLLVSNSCALKAAEFFIFSNGAAGSHSEESSYAAVATSIGDFLKGTTSDDLLRKHLSKYISDTIEWLFYLVCFKPAARYDSIADDRSAKEVLSIALDKFVFSMSLSSIAELLKHVNLVLVLTSLRVRMEESRSSLVQTQAFDGVVLIAANLTPQTSHCIFRSVLFASIAAASCNHALIDLVVRCISSVVHCLKHYSDDGKKIRKAGAAYFKIIQEYFAEVLCLLCAVRRLGSYHPYEIGSYLTQAYAELSLDVNAAVIVRECNCAVQLLAAAKDLFALLHHMDFPGVILYAPSCIGPHLDLQFDFTADIGEDDKLLARLIDNFTTILDGMKRGEVVSNNLVWIYLTSIHECLVAMTDSSLFCLSKSSMAQFVSSLIVFIHDQTSPSGEFIEIIMSIIGRFGAGVDASTLNITSYRPKDATLSEKSQDAILDLSFSLIGKLFGAPKLAGLASPILKYLQSSGTLTSFESKSSPYKDMLACLSRCTLPPAGFIVKTLRNSLLRSTAWTSEVWSTHGRSYDTWICNLCVAVISDCYSSFLRDELGVARGENFLSAKAKRIEGGNPFFAPLGGICALLPSFAADTLILIICDLVAHNGKDSEALVVISKYIREYIFSPACAMKEAIQFGCRLSSYLLRQNILENAERSYKAAENQSAISVNITYNMYLTIDFSEACLAAIRCGYASSALLFYELHKESPSLVALPPDTLFRIYKDLSDPDALSGIKQGGSNLEQQAVISAQSGNWIEAMMNYECILQLEEGTVKGDPVVARLVDPHEGLRASLSALGADFMNRTMEQGRSAMDDLSQWQLASADQTRSSASLEQSAFHSILSEISKGNFTTASARIKVVTGPILPALHSSLYEETAHKLNIGLHECENLAGLSELISICSEQYDGDSPAKACISRWRSKNQSRAALWNRYSIVVEVLLARDRISPFDALNFIEDACSAVSSKIEAYSVSPLFYKFKRHVFSKREGLANAEKLLITAKWSIIESMLLWKKQLQSSAILILADNVIAKLPLPVPPANAATSDLLSEAYRLCGEWSFTTRRATESHINEKYLLPAVKCAVSAQRKIKSHLALAEFNAKLYQSLIVRKQSQEWKALEQVAAERVLEQQRCLKLINGKKINEASGSDAERLEYKELKRHYNVLLQEIKIDKSQTGVVDDSLVAYLHTALHHFGQVLLLSTEADLEPVFAMVNLWLSNFDDEKVISAMRPITQKCASFKFIPLHYQIISRLGSSGQESQSLLLDLVVRLCIDHPFHTLPSVFTITNNETHQRNKSGTDVAAKLRISAATKILQQVGRSEKRIHLVASMQAMLDAYIELAQTSTSVFQDNGILKNISFKELVKGRASRCFTDCIIGAKELPAVLSSSPAIDPTCEYKDVVRLVTFNPKFSITDTGVSRPKIIECEGSDGRVYRELVKGGDDLRQDAVMQQVFHNVVFTLNKDPETRKRNLSIRTYKIIPLTSQTGVIEWVNNTVPLGSYLTDRDKTAGAGAHTRYFPKDWTHGTCREFLKEATLGSQRDALLAIYQNFHPVFRYFFIEKFSDPVKWMSARTTYTRSVAASSMVGYILGIGDRHSHNILVDTGTAEVVHIDFGIVFEQGKVLPTPETVPFRLTRDLVDGMGITGVEGTFKRCCEETLRVLRLNTSLLLTILEVVIHDPFYKWRLSPKQGRQRQGDGNMVGRDDHHQIDVDNDAARRTIIRIKNKLQGYDESAGEGLSVEGQVELLINEAINPERLCKIFPGWAPWL